MASDSSGSKDEDEGKSITGRKTAKRGRGINTVKDELHVDIHASGLLTF